jgi:hypothetical protein
MHVCSFHSKAPQIPDAECYAQSSLAVFFAISLALDRVECVILHPWCGRSRKGQHAWRMAPIAAIMSGFNSSFTQELS